VSSADIHQISLPIRFRIIPHQTYPGEVNMRLDNYFASIGNEKFEPVLRFYGWKPFCISIGYHQNQNVLKLDRIRDHGYDVVRRPTGGRAIFHARELTYSIVMPASVMTHRKLYAFFHQVIAAALIELGYDVILTSGLEKLPRISQTAQDFPCFTKSAETEIQFQGKKVVGSAQKLFKSTILQHGSILLRTNHKRLHRYLDTDEKQLNKIKKEIENKTICLSEIKNDDITPEEIMTTVVKQLESVESISVYFQELCKREMAESKAYEISL
jgi:lipoate-protein ligase A